MQISMHPDAEKNFNEKAEACLENFHELAERQPKPYGTWSEKIPTIHLEKKDVIGELEGATVDYRGEVISRHLYISNRKFGFKEEDYENNLNLAKQIQAIPRIRNMLSLSFIEKSLFEWICNKRQRKTSDPFIQFLTSMAEKKITKYRLWVPIANFQVQTSFEISNSEIRPLSKTQIDLWTSTLNHPEFFEKMRKELQGSAAIVTEIEAERKLAEERAIFEAKQILSILGIFSPAILIPDIKCLAQVKGSESQNSVRCISETKEKKFLYSQSSTDGGKNCPLIWSTEKIQQFRLGGLGRISSLMNKTKPTNYEIFVLDSWYLYSRAAFTDEPLEKLIFILSALEGALIKNENEPIMQNLSERLAFFIGRSLDRRKEIISIIKTIYGIRSKFLHHGLGSKETEEMSEFLMCAWEFFHQLLENINVFKTKDEFIQKLEDYRLS